jgi:hypothetical protein
VLTIAVTLVIAAGVALVWVRVVETLKEPASGPKTIGQPGALVWDGRVFTAPAQLKAYLNSQGLSYKRWAARHPAAFGASAPATTKHKRTRTPTAKHTATTPAKTVTTAARPRTPRVSAPAVGDAKPKPLTSMVLTLVLLIAGLALAASATLPPRYAPGTLQRFYAAPDRRMAALAAATAILMGFGVSFYLT